jgi:TRAP-type C4-dicarboxylate transport system permease small subunit
VIQAAIIAVVVLSLALCWRNSHRDAGMTRLEALRIRMKIIFLVLTVCGLCSKAVVHTYRHFNPPPPPIVGP